MGRHKKQPAEPTVEVGESEGARKARLAEQDQAEKVSGTYKARRAETTTEAETRATTTTEEPRTPAEQEQEEQEWETTTTLREPERGEKKAIIEVIVNKYPEYARDNQTLTRLCNEEAKSRGINMTFSTPEVASYKSQMKKKEGGEDNSALFTSRSHTTKREASATDLKRVKKVADERGGIKQLAEDLQDLITLANEVGGLDSLQECIEFWQSMED